MTTFTIRKGHDSIGPVWLLSWKTRMNSLGKTRWVREKIYFQDILPMKCGRTVFYCERRSHYWTLTYWALGIRLTRHISP